MMKKQSVKASRATARIDEAMSVLESLGMPAKQSQARSALTLLALLDLRPETSWARASAPMRGVKQMMLFFKEHYGWEYAENTRETVRRQTLHQFLEAGLVELNPDKPDRPTNSGQTVYQVQPVVLELLRTFGTPEWPKRLRTYLAKAGTLKERYAQAREMRRIPVTTASGKVLTLSPGGQNELIKDVLELFCPRYTPKGQLLYVGDTQEKWALHEASALRALGVQVKTHGKMPDVVVYYRAKGWLVLIEAVTSHGPVNPKRHRELKELFKNSRAGLVFVTAFKSRRALVKYLDDISWETEVWVADAPDHLIHFNGERFLGPYPEGATG